MPIFALIMNIRKHISIILSSLILFANVGLALNVHYCHNTLTTVSITYKVTESGTAHHHNQADETKSCCKKVPESNKQCCKNNVVKLQDKADTAIVKALQLNLGAFYTVSEWKPSQLFATKITAGKKENPSFYCESNAPPLYKLYCQYVLYA
jgi:hypothetical protein